MTVIHFDRKTLERKNISSIALGLVVSFGAGWPDTISKEVILEPGLHAASLAFAYVLLNIRTKTGSILKFLSS
ncbi:MAG: hypothetical protein M9932_14845 [Xanthobacteraceae bacterium]|nr:hypothetical protein [Xanthobacteraceae bacterium]